MDRARIGSDIRQRKNRSPNTVYIFWGLEYESTGFHQRAVLVVGFGFIRGARCADSFTCPGDGADYWEEVTMKVKMNTGLIPIFSGTYGTQWEVTEYDEDGQDLEVEYKFSEFMGGIARAYDADSPQILRDLRYYAPFITGITFPGTYYSPSEYNFSTDVLDFVLDVKSKMLRTKLLELKGLKEFADFLSENFRSRDGFISFTPHTYDGIYDSIINHRTGKYDAFEQAFAALVTFLCGDELREIEDHVYNYWQGNGYGGLNYTTVEPELESEVQS